MPITRIPYPSALPTAQADYVKQNDLLEIGFMRVNDPAPVDFTAGQVKQGAVFQCGGTVYYTDADTAIGGAASQYVKLTPAGGGATLTPAYVASLAGVTWNAAYNGYYDGGGNLYVFDEGRAMQAGEIAAVVGRYVMQTRDGDVYVGRDVIAGRDASIVRNILFPKKVSQFGLQSDYAMAVGVWTKLTLDVTIENGIVGCSIAGSVISLPAGMYWFHISGETDTAYRLRNTTAGVTLWTQWSTFIRPVIVSIAVTSNFEVQYYTGGADTMHGRFTLGGETVYDNMVFISRMW